jgi:hypothetical protein
MPVPVQPAARGLNTPLPFSMALLPSILVRPDHGDGELELELSNEHESVLTIRSKRYPDPSTVLGDEDDED